MMSPEHPIEHLGDGLYAQFDGFSVILSAPRAGGTAHWVGIEPTVMRRLIEFAMTSSGDAMRQIVVDEVKRRGGI